MKKLLATLLLLLVPAIASATTYDYQASNLISGGVTVYLPDLQPWLSPYYVLHPGGPPAVH